LTYHDVVPVGLDCSCQFLYTLNL